MGFISNIIIQIFRKETLKSKGKGVNISKRANIVGKSNIELGDSTSILDYAFIHCGKWKRNGVYGSTDESEFITIGKNCSIQPYAYLTSGGGFIKIGDNCSINPFCVLYGGGGLTIGNNVAIATGVTMVPQSHRVLKGLVPSFNTGKIRQPILIEDNVWLGAKSIILGNVTIGKGAIVAAGAVVTKDVPKGAYVAGVPARVLKFREDIGVED